MVKFLVIRFKGEAEINLAASVAERLDREVEDSEIHFLTSKNAATLLEHNPHIHRLYTDENFGSSLKSLKGESFDYLIDLQNNLQSARVKLSLKRMDFTVKRQGREGKTDMKDRFMATIRLFVED